MYCDEVRPYWLMVTKGYGFTAEDIDNSCPADLKPYEKAYMLEQENRDIQMWGWMGAYVQKAMICAMDSILNGKKAKVEYFEKPIFGKQTKEDKELTEDEIRQLRLQHRLDMEVMKANFDLTHPKKEVNNE